MTYEYDIAIPGGGPSLTTGERRLMLAILEDAMRTLLGHRYGSRHVRLQREDLDWLMSDDMDDPFTYLRICDALGIDADWLRRRILTARAELEDSAALTAFERRSDRFVVSAINDTGHLHTLEGEDHDATDPALRRHHPVPGASLSMTT